MSDDVLDPELVRYYQDKALEAGDDDMLAANRRTDDEPELVPAIQGRHRQWKEAQGRRAQLITTLRDGGTVLEACAKVGISYSTYASWRQRIPHFAERADAAKVFAEGKGDAPWDGTHAQFHLKYFGHKRTWFQLRAIDEIHSMPRGNVLMILWPPEFGKTTTFEDHATETLALNPAYRFLVGCESRELAERVLGKVMDRMDPMGPTPEFVERFGPFIPQTGGARRQAWSQIRFRVHKARHSDQRDYSMRALGVGSKQTVGSRTDHFHLDDLQSVTTFSLANTKKVVRWVRQDVFSRAGQSGITTIFGTRVEDNDALEELMNDPELDDTIFKAIVLPALYIDPTTNELTSLWPEKWPVEALLRQKKLAGPEGWDRNYMQKPGATSKGRGTFNKDAVEPCQDATISLQHRAGPGAVIYIGLDPSIGGRNCVLAGEATHDGRLIIRRIQEDTNLKTNAQIAKSVEDVITYVEADGAMCTDLVIEAMAFQKGLIEDESILDLRRDHGVSIRDHYTGLNKIDEDIGVPSMARDFNEKRIVLPWAADDYTRFMVGQLKSQLYAWKPGERGNRLRQDMVMALWFLWILWRERYKRPVAGKAHQSGFKVQGLPYAPTNSGLLVPVR